ncbi:uncharacterized protein LTR77_000262 [Saxophila tyrrhenica]|uniref:Putative phospholipase n=1 Tax=Saxophila tyrrhenica TaxID=1690608 RepID=A0AAV9PNN1_9PEZI|nr:hypothetical protein LTR77_000262 [Saxophila tyrrhenica]
MPLLSSKLPNYSGPYQVGVVDIEAPTEKRLISEHVFKDTQQPAFALESVLFSMYYPANKGAISTKPHHPWISDFAQQGEGYARFARINNVFTNNIFSWALWTLVGSTVVPAEVDVPIYGTSTQYDSSTEVPMEAGLPKFPVIVFSHGMASSRTSYTQWCGELASLGFIVAAIEHRDGSGPGSSVMLKDGSSREVYHISESMLEPQPETPEFKQIQIAMRQAEIEETVRVLRQINDGHGKDVFASNARSEGDDLAAWRGRINMDRIVVGGHSYGATGALQALKDAPNDKRPFVGGLILDPGKQSGPLQSDIDVPILVVHSQSWSARHSIFEGRPHFEVVKDLVKKVMRKKEGKKQQSAWFLTSKGTSHPSVTDAPLIEPMLLSWTTGSTIDVREGVMQYVKVGEEFMHFLENGERIGVLAEDVTHPVYDQDERDPERKAHMSQDIGKYWQIHVAPPSTDKKQRG